MRLSQARLRLAVACCLLSTGSGVASPFHPDCTLPPPGTSWVAEPSTRSSSHILWNCLSVIILCTWNIQHLNVPGIRGRPNGFSQSTWWTVLDSMKRAKWMLLTVLVPEYLLGKALCEWLSARISVKMMKDKLGGAHDWEMIHAYMANMGYFVLDCGEHLDEHGNPWSEHPGPVDHPQSHGRQKEGASSDSTAVDRARHLGISGSRLKHRYWALSAQQWFDAAVLDLADLPTVRSDELVKLDKGGALEKGLAVVQVAYLIVQLMVRRAKNLPSTQLEIAALAFAAVSIATYLLYWNRPQGVGTIHTVKAKKVTKSAIKIFGFFGPVYAWMGYRPPAAFDPRLGPAPIPNDATHPVSDRYIADGTRVGAGDEVLTVMIGTLLAGTLFGGLHCLAWDLEFSTPVAKLLWRLCSVATTCLPTLSFVPAALWVRASPGNDRQLLTGYYFVATKKSWAAGIGMGTLLLLYFLARGYLIVESFRSLSYLPPAAFTETWSAALPNWG
jgi:hypothetical protein